VASPVFDDPDAFARLIDEFYPYRDRFTTNRRLPAQGRLPGEVLADLQWMAEREDAQGHRGQVSGSLYHGDPEHYAFLTKAFGLFAHANVLQRDMYPSATKLEAEIVAMTAAMLHGEAAADACGVLTGGGSESLTTQLLTYRDHARATRGVTAPQAIIPVTAHCALDKAGHYFGVEILHAPVDDDWRVDLDWVAEHVSDRTICLVGSAGNYPHGVVDPIAGLGEIALRHRIGLHVDGCLGGFILPWAQRLGYDVPAFDFAVPGVTSISADTHKYGYALKGTSVLLYRDRELRRHQYFAAADWPGGMYISPGMAGSRSGGLIAATWAAMTTLGEAGYLDAARGILTTADTMRAGVATVDGLGLLGDSPFVVAFRSAEPDLDIFVVNDELIARGWRLNGLQRPAGLHFCVTRPNAAPGVVERFLDDLAASVGAARGRPVGSARSGALYGLSGAGEAGVQAVSGLLTAALDAFYEPAP
jgi:glutamate/tyrosine decarboxylase-like PLP-dependent enzyme